VNHHHPSRRPQDAALSRRTGRHLWRGMVGWFSPSLLLRTLFTVLAARLFGRYADRRDAMQSRPADGPFAFDDRNEIWFDYVADLGDGWDATATVASALAAPELVVAGEALPHGRVLVMGGDAVYPAASRGAYLQRLEAPYYSVLPFSPEEAPRDLFVLPGNHDWYDGLAAFSALFMQQRWFAGWKTRQSRSYFALKLPQRWWFIAADIQLDNDIDATQRDYLLAATAAMQPGDRVLLACAEPFWLAPPGSIAQRNMAWLQRKLVSERGAQVWVSLSGDLHHYQRHENGDGAQRIVSGGGGAFLHGTAWQPDVIAEPVEVPSAEDTGSAATRRWLARARFPSPAVSRLTTWRLLLFPFFNAGFALFLGGVLTLLFWGLDAASNGLLFGNIALGAAVGPMVVLESLTASPWLAAGIVAWFAAFVAFVDPPPQWSPMPATLVRSWLGVTHAFVQLWIGLHVLAWLMPSRLDDFSVFFGMLVELWLLLAVLNGLCFGIYLFLGYQLLGLHREAAFAACRIADWKHFLRLHIAADGTLTIRCIGIPRVCRRWRTRQPKARGEAFAEPADDVAMARRLLLVETVVIAPR
jgi:hypothetical protein